MINLRERRTNLYQFQGEKKNHLNLASHETNNGVKGLLLLFIFILGHKPTTNALNA
jgi:hypothetical protein